MSIFSLLWQPWSSIWAPFCPIWPNPTRKVYTGSLRRKEILWVKTKRLKRQDYSSISSNWGVFVEISTAMKTSKKLPIFVKFLRIITQKVWLWMASQKRVSVNWPMILFSFWMKLSRMQFICFLKQIQMPWAPTESGCSNMLCNKAPTTLTFKCLWCVYLTLAVCLCRSRQLMTDWVWKAFRWSRWGSYRWDMLLSGALWSQSSRLTMASI